MRRNDLSAMMMASVLCEALGGSGLVRYHQPRHIRPLTNETSKSKAKLVGNKRSKRRNKAKGRQA